MRICWICDTAYQLLNCINYVVSNKLDDSIVDLYIGRQFFKAEEIERKIKKENIFHMVVAYKPLRNEKGILGTIRKVCGIIWPKYRLSRMLIDDIQLIPDKYDAVFMSVPTYFPISIVFQANADNVFYFDDGSGSYTGDVSAFSLKTRIIYFILGHSLKRLKPKALYLNDVSFCRSTMNCKKLQLPRIGKENSDVVKLFSRIFEYKNDDYYLKHRIIYLMWPNDNDDKMKENIDEKILSILKDADRNVLLRPHPRQTDIDRFGMGIDNHCDMWELVCADQITDNHVLIGFFSTAQMIPKIMYNCEPTLILLYYLYPTLFSSQRKMELDYLAEKIKSVYSCPEKIIIPKNFVELESIIVSITADEEN